MMFVLQHFYISQRQNLESQSNGKESKSTQNQVFIE